MPISYHEHRQHIARLSGDALKAADPRTAVEGHLRLKGRTLVVGSTEYDLARGRVYLVAIGKASARMGATAARVIQDTSLQGVLIAKHNHLREEERALLAHEPGTLRLFEASHPISDQASIGATNAVIQLLENTTSDDLVLCLISGGASALLTQPRVELAVWNRLIDTLLSSGCTINELNTVRRHLDSIKGGGLARLASPATCISLILSDVIGNPLDVIGSGPTVPQVNDARAARAILERYDVQSKINEGTWQVILQALRQVNGQESFELPEAHNFIVGDVRLAAEAAVSAARKLGFSACLATAHLVGEAREVGRVAAAIAKDAAPGSCFVFGGETTVTLRGNGLGGRNQELALAAAIDLDGYDRVAIASLATDGEDGPTDAAGAIVTGETVSIARSKGIDPLVFLDNNDSYGFFDRVGGLIKFGPTGTNVNDLLFVTVY